MIIPAFDPFDHLGECRALFDLGYMFLSHILVTDFGYQHTPAATVAHYLPFSFLAALVRWLTLLSVERERSALLLALPSAARAARPRDQSRPSDARVSAAGWSPARMQRCRHVLGHACLRLGHACLRCVVSISRLPSRRSPCRRSSSPQPTRLPC